MGTGDHNSDLLICFIQTTIRISKNYKQQTNNGHLSVIQRNDTARYIRQANIYNNPKIYLDTLSGTGLTVYHSSPVLYTNDPPFVICKKIHSLFIKSEGRV